MSNKTKKPTTNAAAESEPEEPTESLDELIASFWRARREGHAQNEAAAVVRIRAISPTWGSSIA